MYSNTYLRLHIYGKKYSEENVRKHCVRIETDFSKDMNPEELEIAVCQWIDEYMEHHSGHFKVSLHKVKEVEIGNFKFCSWEDLSNVLQKKIVD